MSEHFEQMRRMAMAMNQSPQARALGLEIMGPAWSDATVLRVGHQFEQAAGTRDRRPAL